MRTGLAGLRLIFNEDLAFALFIGALAAIENLTKNYRGF
jgi:hypothetical protein